MKRSIRRVGITAVIAGFALLAGWPIVRAALQASNTFVRLPLVSGMPLGLENKPVAMQGFQFGPKTITVNVGDSITWTNGDSVEHTAQADDGSFNSGDLNADGTYAFIFTKAGTFPYYCKYHGGPNGVGMSGTIVVQEVVQ